MFTMATEERTTRHYIQTLQWLKNQYTAWAANMRATRTYATRPGHTSNDAIGNALFMWAREQNAEELAKKLEPYLNRFQGIWDEKEGSEYTGEVWVPDKSDRDQTSLVKPKPARRPRKTLDDNLVAHDEGPDDPPAKGKGKRA